MDKKQILTGVPYHVEKMTRAEGDEKRHSHRCVYFRNTYNNKKASFCDYYYEHCRGAAHCVKYHEEKKKTSIHVDNVLDSKKTFVQFEGIKYVELSDIYVDPKSSVYLHPSEEKKRTLIQYVKYNGDIDKPIVVSCCSGCYEIKDKYLRYVVAKELGLKEVPVEMGTEEQISIYNKLRTLGTLVYVKKEQEVGQVIGYNIHQVDIMLDSKQTVSYDIHLCVKNDAIRVI